MLRCCHSPTSVDWGPPPLGNSAAGRELALLDASLYWMNSAGTRTGWLAWVSNPLGLDCLEKVAHTAAPWEAM